MCKTLKQIYKLKQEKLEIYKNHVKRKQQYQLEKLQIKRAKLEIKQKQLNLKLGIENEECDDDD